MKDRLIARMLARGLLVCALAVLALPVLSPTAHAANVAVDCGGGDDLQTAIDNASSGDTLDITGTCTGNFTIDSKDLTLVGTDGDATIDGGGTGSALSISGPTTQTVTLDLLVVSGGETSGFGGGIHIEDGTVNVTHGLIQDNAAGGGGGISFEPSNADQSQGLSLTDTTVRDNVVSSPEVPSGGGILFNGFNGGTLSLTRTTVSGNIVEAEPQSGADASGGGVQVEAATATIVNSTISGNTLTPDGQSPSFGGGISFLDGDADITSTTIAANTAAGAFGLGGGLFLGVADPTLTATIVAGNTATGAGPDCTQNSGGNPYASGGYNLIGDTTDCGYASDPTDVLNTPAELGPLANNGGWGKTHRPDAASPAVDAIPKADCPVATDQRGISRPRKHGCDIGSVERSTWHHTALCTIQGTSGNDTITGTKRDDSICGMAGNDTIDGLTGDDLLFGYAGRDTEDGGPGDDMLHGMKGKDDLTGGPGSDVLKGGWAPDQLNAVDGEADALDGGKGHDTCNADPGDTVTSC